MTVEKTDHRDSRAGLDGWERVFLGPVAGFAAAAAILAMSVLIGTLSGWHLAKALGAVVTAAAIGLAVALTVLARQVRRVLPRVISDVAAEQLDRLTALENRLSHHLAAVDSILSRAVAGIAEQVGLSDVELAYVESSPATCRVIICRKEMGGEFGGDAESYEVFRGAVEANLKRGVTYTWLSEDNPLSRQREKLVRELFPEYVEQIRVRRLTPMEWKGLPFSFETAFYVQRRTQLTEVVGYADVSFSTESGRLWRQLDRHHCTEWYDEVESYLGG